MVPRCLWMGEGITFPALNPAEKTAGNFMRWRTCNDLRESTSDENRCCSLANQRGKLNRESETIRNCMNYMPGHRSGWWCRNCYRPSGSALPTHGTKQLHHCFGQPQFVQTVGMIPQACHFNPKNLDQPLDQPLDQHLAPQISNRCGSGLCRINDIRQKWKCPQGDGHHLQVTWG